MWKSIDFVNSYKQMSKILSQSIPYVAYKKRCYHNIYKALIKVDASFGEHHSEWLKPNGLNQVFLLVARSVYKALIKTENYMES